jgi:hypothetical protein
MLRGLVASILVIAIAVASGCTRNQPIYNVENAAVPIAGKQLSVDQVRTAIIRALVQKRWSVSDESEGRLEATIHVRSHMARINIDYSPTRYSITYKDSAVLNYDGATIHRNYNRWIMQLQDIIKRELLLQ